MRTRTRVELVLETMSEIATRVHVETLVAYLCHRNNRPWVGKRDNVGEMLVERQREGGRSWLGTAVMSMLGSACLFDCKTQGKNAERFKDNRRRDVTLAVSLQATRLGMGHCSERSAETSQRNRT